MAACLLLTAVEEEIRERMYDAIDAYIYTFPLYSSNLFVETAGFTLPFWCSWCCEMTKTHASQDLLGLVFGHFLRIRWGLTGHTGHHNRIDLPG